MDERKQRRGIQSIEIAFRVLTALQTSPQAMALKDIAPLAGLTTSAVNNYLVSLVRTGLAAADERPGCYRLGPAALGLGMSAIQQIDGFEIVRREVTTLRDATKRSAAVTTWTDDGPVSVFKQDGEQRGAFEFRTGLIPMLSSAAGKIYTAYLPPGATIDLINREWEAVFGGKPNAERFREEARRELKRKGYSAIVRADVSAYVSIAAPVFDWHGQVRFTLSLAGTRATMQIEPASDLVKALLESAARATSALGGKASEDI
ncbi:IclR family transcriptional regulator [Methylocapsa sp. S129]|uniref:IclR family transcriptional regulator n=1 Tax=Methylocapsa sp. S129 TaxID=1641869 RepID=UPI00131ECB2D|nr:helix-turn-helix domain-containing protein [Methylocapsa sp. S129]